MDNEDSEKEEPQEKKIEDNVSEEKHEAHKESDVKKRESRKESGTLTDKMRENPWVATTLVLGVVVLIFIVAGFGGVTGGSIGVNDAGDMILNFVQSQTGGEGELVEVTEYEEYFYKIIILFQGQEVPLYMTKDGSFLVQGLTPLVNEAPAQNPESGDVVKSDFPESELFIMTHCPYGTQAEKGFIPAMKALGETVDAKIRYVHYFMHEPEETETPRQVCIREEQSDKFLDYLECFLEDGDYDRCLSEVNIDMGKLNECVNSGKADEYYAEDSALSEGYGVRGSPTLVINGQITSSGRDSASYLTTICSAFSDSPDECNAELLSASPSPMWGWDETGSATDAQC